MKKLFSCAKPALVCNARSLTSDRPGRAGSVEALVSCCCAAALKPLLPARVDAAAGCCCTAVLAAVCAGCAPSKTKPSRGACAGAKGRLKAGARGTDGMKDGMEPKGISDLGGSVKSG